jgi:hypothetical protein
VRRVLAEAAVIWLAGIVWSGLVRWWSVAPADVPAGVVEDLHDALREPTPEAGGEPTA